MEASRRHLPGTPERTLAEARAGASAEACARYLSAAQGEDINLDLRLTHVRMEPPSGFWATYEPAEGLAPRPGFLIAVRGFFDEASFENYADAVAGRLGGLPLSEEGAMGMDRGSLTAWWTLPFDPALPGLRATLTGDRLLQWLRGHGYDPEPRPRRLHYLPEIHCAVQWDMRDATGTPVSTFGKVLPPHEAAKSWAGIVALAGSGVAELVEVPRPVAHWPEGGLVLQSGLATATDGPVRLIAPQLAGRVIAEWHHLEVPESADSVIPGVSPYNSLNRLKRSLPTFRLTAPRVYRQLTDYLRSVERRIEQSGPESMAICHGDYKREQFIRLAGGGHGIIDLETLCFSEPSMDLGSYTAYLMPSHPRDWEDTATAECDRQLFLESYVAAGGDFNPVRLGIYESLALATRGLTHLWAQTEDWEYVADALITLAFERLKTQRPREVYALPA